MELVCLVTDLREISGHLSGIDISENMISKADELNIYDNLYTGDIVEALNSIQENFDLFVALDVLSMLEMLSPSLKQFTNTLIMNHSLFFQLKYKRRVVTRFFKALDILTLIATS